MTTIYEVAARAGVSPATVSRVLNGNPGVKDALAQRVKAAVDELKYRPNQVARSMRTQRTGIIATVVPDIENPFFTLVVRGADVTEAELLAHAREKLAHFLDAVGLAARTANAPPEERDRVRAEHSLDARERVQTSPLERSYVTPRAAPRGRR